MELNKYILIALFAVVIISLGVLLVIQFRILEKDIENNRNMMAFAIPGILSDLYDNMMFNRDIRKYTDDFQGTEDFSFTSDSSLIDSLQIVLKNGIDEVLSLNYPDLKYEVNGFMSNEFGCMIHRSHRPELPKARRVMNAQNHLCFCMILNNTLDISMNYTNTEEEVIGNSAELLKTSFLLIVIILSIFGYAFYTIRKQKKLSDLKRDFINNLTHEFKTPIFSISLAAKSLKEKEEVKRSDKMNSYVDLIGHETKRLQTQVDKILQMAMLDAGHLTLEKKKLDIHESINHVTSGFAIIIEEKGGSISLDLQAKKYMITVDETHLNNVLYNLIDNAQKYTDGAPDIKITTLDNPNGIKLIIKDHGIGMDKTTQKYVFDQFYRVQQGDVHTVKGFGLGLSYVKRIIEIHKGYIHLHSDLGKGSEFSIFLPLTT